MTRKAAGRRAAKDVNGRFERLSEAPSMNPLVRRVFADLQQTCRALAAGATKLSRPMDLFANSPYEASVCVIEPVEGGRDWRYTRVGADLVRFFGVDATGHLVSEIYDAQKAREGIALFNHIASTHYEPRLLQIRYEADQVSDCSTENIFVPIPTVNGRGVCILGIMFLSEPEPLREA